MARPITKCLGGFLTVCLFLLSPVSGADREHYQYRNQTGDACFQMDWRLEHGQGGDQGLKLTSQTDQDTTLTITDAQYATIRWKYNNPADQTAIVAERKGNRIHIDGRLRGDKLHRVLSIDTAPWYQATSLSLRPFIRSPQKKIRFWTLRPDTFTAHELTATKQEITSQNLFGRTIAVQKVKLAPLGMLALFWNGNYCFQKDNGLMIKYESPSGPPGSPKTTIRLTHIH